MLENAIKRYDSDKMIKSLKEWLAAESWIKCEKRITEFNQSLRE